jgi:uncharacterized protein YndB with AHSA1/START domain
MSMESMERATPPADRGRHWTEATMKQHEEMGFVEGWGACADQLVALCEGREI